MRYVFAVESAIFVLAIFLLAAACLARIRWVWLRVIAPLFAALVCAFVTLLASTTDPRHDAMYPTLVCLKWACLATMILGAAILPIAVLWPRGPERTPVAHRWRRLRIIRLVALLLALILATIAGRDWYVRRWMARVRAENAAFIASVSPTPVAPSDDAGPAYREIYREMLRGEAAHAREIGRDITVAGESEMPDWLAHVYEPAFDVSQPDVLAFCARHRQNVLAAIAASRRRGATLSPPGSTALDDDVLDGMDEVRALHELVELEARRYAREGNAIDCWECLLCLERLKRHASLQGHVTWAQMEKSLEHRRLMVVEAILFERALDVGLLPFPIVNDRFSHLPASSDAVCRDAAQTLEHLCASDLGELDNDPRWFSIEEQRLLAGAWPALSLYRVCRRVFVLADGLATLPSDLGKYRQVARKTPHDQSEMESAWIRDFDDPSTSELAARAWNAPVTLYTTAVRADANRRLTAVGIAVAGFRARNGRMPNAVIELVPEFIAEIPLDPWDGQPLRLRNLENGLVLYSVGWNGVDDGGVDDRDEPFWSPDQAFCLGSAFRQRRLNPAAPQ